MTTLEMPKTLANLVAAMNAAPGNLNAVAVVAEGKTAEAKYDALDARAKQKYRAALKADRAVIEKAAKGELAKARKVANANPTAQSLYEVGSLYQQLGDNKNAKQYFTKALKLNSKHSDALNDLGLSLLREAKLNPAKVDAALTPLTQARKLDPSLPANNVAAAQELRSLSRVAKAKAAPPDYNIQGVGYLKLSDFKSAKDCFKKAIAQDPNNAEALNNLALTYIYDDLEIGKALDAAVKALSINPNLPTQPLILATTLANQAVASDA